MTITLGQLRTFCQEEATKDSQGTTSERAFMHFINNALGRLYRDLTLDLTRREVKITVPPVIERSDGVVTQNSLAITSATGFLAVWATQRYGLHVGGEDRLEFEVAAVDPGLVAATLRSGDEWIQASGTGKTFTFVKNKFLLTSTLEVENVRTLNGRCVEILSPSEFDDQKNTNPTLRTDDPQFCVFRNNYLEIYPSPSSSYGKLLVTYRLAWTPLSSAAAADGGDADATTIAWPDEQLDVLKKAIMLEASISQGENAPVSYGVAALEYEKELKRLKAVETKDKNPGPLMVKTPISPRGWGRRSHFDTTEIEEID